MLKVEPNNLLQLKQNMTLIRARLVRILELRADGNDNKIRPKLLVLNSPIIKVAGVTRNFMANKGPALLTVQTVCIVQFYFAKLIFLP